MKDGVNDGEARPRRRRPIFILGGTDTMKVTRKYDPEVKTMYYTIEAPMRPWPHTVDQMNAQTLEDFYIAVKWLLERGYEEYCEEYSNTINPAQQNAFIALRSYRVKRNGHYKSVKIFAKFDGGCSISECNILNEWSK